MEQDLIDGTLRFFNTYSRATGGIPAARSAGAEVKMYTCGPTVYNHAHIGNFRAYLFEDLLQRHLELRGYAVRAGDESHRRRRQDDSRLSGGGRAAGGVHRSNSRTHSSTISTRLRIKRADTYPGRDEPRHIAAMIAMIEMLIARGLAYQAEDKSVYFRIKNFPDYGKLAHFNLDELRSTGRVKNDEYEKEHIGDFALWKAWDEADGDVRGRARGDRAGPGWHIECSAMATEILGEQLDIHCGGVDNIFPHHEAEIAQTEGCTGKQFVRYWLHCAHLLVDGQKMSKSLGNFYTLRDVLAKGYSGREVRYALLRVHYRAQLNFTWEGMEEARQALARIDDWVARLRAKAAKKTSQRSTSNVQRPTEEFEEALDDDLNISAALGFLFETIRETNRALDQGTLTPRRRASRLEWWKRIDACSALTAEETDAAGRSCGARAKRARRRGLPRIGEKVMNCATNSRRSAGKCVTRKDGQKVTRRGG